MGDAIPVQPCYAHPSWQLGLVSELPANEKGQSQDQLRCLNCRDGEMDEMVGENVVVVCGVD